MKKSLKFEVDGKIYYTSKIYRDDCKVTQEESAVSWIEYRQFPRKSCTLPVDYATKERVFHDLVRDISLGGVFIETRYNFSVGQELLLTIPFSDGQKNVKLKGEIVRITPQGIGVSFKRGKKT